MKIAASRRLAAGFTLIELMVAVAIIGILASVALPILTRSQIRARVAERGTILEAVARGVNDAISSAQRLPDASSPEVWSGLANPPGTPGTAKRVFDYARAGWRWMPIIVQGSCYYSYSFQANDPIGGTASAWVQAEGDLDGDGVPSVKTISYESKGYSLRKLSEVPVEGAEDATTF